MSPNHRRLEKNFLVGKSFSMLFLIKRKAPKLHQNIPNDIIILGVSNKISPSALHGTMLACRRT
jgi:hypothetical protein